MIKIPEFNTKKELFTFLIENKDTLIAQKKAEYKHADGILYTKTIVNDKITSTKSNDPINANNLEELKVVVIINTTNLMDSHDDVHFPGIWKKSLKENKFIMHVQEHKMGEFNKIISEGKDLKAYVKNFNWKELGYDYEGITQALVFESTIKRKRNPFMFDQYANGYVKNHSVGMRYVKLMLAINDKDYPMEFETWNKYISGVANVKDAEENGYFYVVLEAKVIEGSAVPLGSNHITPTLDNNKQELTPTQKEISILKNILQVMKEPKQEPFTDTQKSDTQKELDILTEMNNKLKL